MKKKGFTLIELLIVIAIIGILSAALLPTILNAPARGRDAARIGHLNQLVAGLEAWNADKNQYPRTPGCIGSETVFEGELDHYFSGGTPPMDPKGVVDAADADAGINGCDEFGMYYYNYLGSVDVGDYILATKMELITGNNTHNLPNSFDENSITGVDYSCKTTPETDCKYYILVK